MISSVGSNSALESIASILQSSGLSSSSSMSSIPGTSGDSSTLSGPAQLFSELQQLASSDPTLFKQLASEIAQQLQTAAGVSNTSSTSSTSSSSPIGGANQILANLASKFEEAAQTGNVLVLQPPSGSGQSNGIGTYNQQGQILPSLLENSSSTSGVDMQSLFQSINQEVTDALNSLSGATSTNT
jgi:hypothetical protein